MTEAVIILKPVHWFAHWPAFQFCSCATFRSNVESYGNLLYVSILETMNRKSHIVLYISRTRSSHQRCSTRKDVPKNSAKFIGKHLCQSLLFNRVAGGLFFNNVTDLRPVTLFKKRLWYRYFPVNFAKFLRTPFL